MRKKGTAASDMRDITKIYVEPTNHCNLSCKTCMRHSWEEALGFMPWQLYDKLLHDLMEFPSVETMAFAGFGEPLLHPRLPDMIRHAHKQGYRTILTTNGILITQRLVYDLIAAGLNQVVVSIDGCSSDVFADVRNERSLEKIIANMQLFSSESKKMRTYKDRITIGIEFVAMKRNLHEMPHLSHLASEIKASFILVSHLLPYTEELKDEVLYNGRHTSHDSEGMPWMPRWILPNIDWNMLTSNALCEIFRKNQVMSFLDLNLNDRNHYCPFIKEGSVAVGWRGDVSPCPPLMHSYDCYIKERKKRMKQCIVGSVGGTPLKDLWNDSSYALFRQRVDNFDYPACSDCGGCDMVLTNESDCFGNNFPVCGDCLWARGLIRCA
ncbi:MAG: radical SAM protein [Deltaproteobacteria bacterium]|nr:radical SAM protein [Deltaproteobacteria bacterium]